MFVTFDALHFEENRIRIRGFAVPEDKGDFNITLKDENGSEIAPVERVYRPDVIRQYAPDNTECLFGMHVSVYADTSGEAILSIVSAKDPSDRTEIALKAYLKKKAQKKALKDKARKVLKSIDPGVELLISEEEKILRAFRKKKALSEKSLNQQTQSVFRHEPVIYVYMTASIDDPYLLEEIVLNLSGQTYGQVRIFVKEDVLGAEAKQKLSEISDKDERVTPVFDTPDFSDFSDGFFLWLPEVGRFEKNAFYEFIKAVNDIPDVKLMYCDEDVWDDERMLHTDVRLKPDFSLTYLRGHNYIGTPFMVRTEIAKTVFEAAGAGLTPYEYVLRAAELSRKHVLHVSGILYAAFSFESREDGMFEAVSDDADECRLIEESYLRDGFTVKAETVRPGFHTVKPVLSGQPLVSVIIPNKDHGDDLKRAVNSLLEKSVYDAFEILIVDNNSTDPGMKKVYLELEEKGHGVRVLHYDDVFNFSAINNFAAGEARGEYLLFLNNDTEVIAEDFLERMVFFSSLPDVGAVGAKLLYADGTIQHAGIIAGAEGEVRHAYSRALLEDAGYMGRNIVSSDFSAVTAACMMTKKTVFDAVRGMDASFPVAYNDVDYCLKLREKGLSVLMVPDALLTHYESKSRGLDQDDASKVRLKAEFERLLSRHKRTLERDPFYHDFFSFERGYFLLPKTEKDPDPDRDRLFLQIDMITDKDGAIEIEGWAISTKGSVTYAITNKKKKEVPIKLLSMSRKDASRTILNNTSQEYCGFKITFPETGEGPYLLSVRDGKLKRTKLISTDFGAEGGNHAKKYRLGFVVKSYFKNPTLSKAYFKEEGLEAFKKQLKGDGKSELYRYMDWFAAHQPDEKTLDMQRKTVFPYAPKISLIVPAYKTPEGFLKEMLASVQNQTYSNWELCVADGSYPETGVIDVLEAYRKEDPRIVYSALTENKGISGNTNKALKLASGDWIALMDHDDILAPDALFEMVKAMNEDPDVEAVYTDEDKVSMDLKTYFQPAFKPDHDFDLLCSGNYICHLFAAKKTVIDAIGEFDSACDGAQDMDFILRCTEKAKKTAHIAKILYHWRSHPNSTAGDSKSKMYCYEAGVLSADKHYARTNIKAKAFMSAYFGHYYTFFEKPEQAPLISVILWGGDQEDAALTENSVIAATDYRNFEFLNGLDAVKEAKGEYLFFIRAGSEIVPFKQVSNNDLLISEDTTGMLSFPYNMLGSLQSEDAGLSAGKVIDQNDTLLYCGALRNPRHAVDYLFRKHESDNVGYNGRALDKQRTSAASWHCMMIRKGTFEKAGGLQAEKYGELSDTALSYALTRMGYRHVFEPTVTARVPFVEPHKPLHLRYPDSAAAVIRDYSDVLLAHDPCANANMTVHMGEYVYRE